MSNVYPVSRIKGMTEHELVNALCTGKITPEQVHTALGDCPRTWSVMKEHEQYRAYCKNPDLYWGERISKLQEQISRLESNRRNKILPPIPYIF